MTLRRMIKRLRLKPGDAILVRRDYANYDYNLTQRICEAGRKSGIKFNVPVIEVPYEKHAVETMPFEQLERAYSNKMLTASPHTRYICHTRLHRFQSCDQLSGGCLSKLVRKWSGIRNCLAAAQFTLKIVARFAHRTARLLFQIRGISHAENRITRAGP